MIYNISDHITFQEAISSSTAERLGISNIPDASQLKNMIELAENIFEPLRAGLGNRPIHINSFFRCEELNKVVGGAKNSQHTAINGAAMDICLLFGGSNKDIFNYIKNNLAFDQLISEFPDEQENPTWVHVSWNTGNNRMNILKSEKKDGNTVYV
jgi:hypothetical protein